MGETVVSCISLSEIDWPDTSCLISYGRAPEKLVRSIRAIGLIQVPVLQRKANGLFRIVCGSRRLAVCRELGLASLSCQLLPEHFSTQVCLRRAIYDNLAKRPLNPVEKSLVLTKISSFMDRSQAISEFMPLLDLEPSAILFERYRTLQRLEPVILDALAEGSLHERTAFALSPLKASDRLTLFHLFEELPYSVSVQEEVVEITVEIALRDGLTAAEVIEAEQIRKLREEKQRPARHRAQDIRRYLQMWRTPRFTARQERFSREVREIGLPAGVRLVPPRHFEGPTWHLECTFQHGDELAERLGHVVHVARQPAFQRLMEGK